VTDDASVAVFDHVRQRCTRDVEAGCQIARNRRVPIFVSTLRKRLIPLRLARQRHPCVVYEDMDAAAFGDDPGNAGFDTGPGSQVTGITESSVTARTQRVGANMSTFVDVVHDHCRAQLRQQSRGREAYAGGAAGAGNERYMAAQIDEVMAMGNFVRQIHRVGPPRKMFGVPAFKLITPCLCRIMLHYSAV
jgi:hypothetical protein